MPYPQVGLISNHKRRRQTVATYMKAKMGERFAQKPRRGNRKARPKGMKLLRGNSAGAPDPCPTVLWRNGACPDRADCGILTFVCQKATKSHRSKAGRWALTKEIL
jgi:hypothetical protein